MPIFWRFFIMYAFNKFLLLVHRKFSKMSQRKVWERCRNEKVWEPLTYRYNERTGLLYGQHALAHFHKIASIQVFWPSSNNTTCCLYPLGVTIYNPKQPKQLPQQLLDFDWWLFLWNKSITLCWATRSHSNPKIVSGMSQLLIFQRCARQNSKTFLIKLLFVAAH